MYKELEGTKGPSLWRLGGATSWSEASAWPNAGHVSRHGLWDAAKAQVSTSL